MEVAWNCISKVRSKCLHLRSWTFQTAGISLYSTAKKIPRPSNSFNLFLKDVKDTIVHNGQGQFLKNAVHKWKNLPYPEKKKYADKAQQAFMEYKEAVNSLSEFEQIEMKEEKKLRKLKLKEEKNLKKLARIKRQKKQLKVSLGLPKQPSSAFNFFVKQVFATNQLSTHDKRLTKVMPEVCRKWESLPFEEKEKFAELSRQDGERYLEEMKVYVKRLREEGKNELLPQRFKNMWLVDENQTKPTWESLINDAWPK